MSQVPPHSASGEERPDDGAPTSPSDQPLEPLPPSVWPGSPVSYPPDPPAVNMLMEVLRTAAVPPPTAGTSPGDPAQLQSPA